MAIRTRYTVSEHSEVIARFVYVDDAQRFAEVATLNTARYVVVESADGWVTRYYRKGYTND